MSMSKANILHTCIGELIDEHIHDDEVLSKIYEMLGELHDIAEGDLENE